MRQFSQGASHMSGPWQVPVYHNHTCQLSMLPRANLFSIHLEDVETRAQRGEAVCPGSHSTSTAKPGQKPHSEAPEPKS